MRSVIGVSSVSFGEPPASGIAPRASARGEIGDPTFAVVLGERAAAPAPGTAAGPSAITGLPVRAALARLADSQRSVDRLIDAAARGHSFTPAQLLALQATVSRDAQAVEVVSRVADRVVGAVKQALSAQA
ncbi:MAG: hypothetical protein ACJ8F1_03125 [Polyangia bacterium]